MNVDPRLPRLGVECSTTVVLALACAAMSATAAVAVAWCRQQVDAPIVGPSVVLALYSFVVSSGAASLAQRPPAVGFLVSLVLMFGIPIVGLAGGPTVGIGLLLAAALVMAMTWARSAATLSVGVTVVAVAFGLVAGVAYFLVFNGIAYTGVLAPETAAAGVQNGDPLFHAAIASMIRGYGAVSTGLDGLVPIRYHALSHLWVGALAELAGIPVTLAYGIVPPIVGIPLLVFYLQTATAHVVGTVAARRCAVAVLLLAGPLAWLSVVDLRDWMSYLVSESYLLALILFLAALPTLGDFAAHGFGPGRRPRLLALLAALPVLALTKLSVGACFAAGSAYLVVRRAERHRVVAVLSLAGIGTVLALLMFATASSSHVSETAFDPWHFPRAYPDGAMGNLTVVGVLLPLLTWSWWRAHTACRPWFEALAVMVVAATVPALVLRIGGGSAYYFLNIATWLGVIYLAGAATRCGAGRYAAAAAGATVIVLVVCWMQTPTKRNATSNFAERTDRLIEQAGGQSGERGWGGADGRFAAIAALRTHMAGERLARQFAAAGIAGARDVLVQVLPGNTTYWTLNPVHCRNAPMLIPAYAGLPLLFGLPPASEPCDLNRYYGYPEYDHARSFGRDVDDAARCAAAAERGFARVYVAESLEDGRMLDCARLP
ncbi:MAG: hypothetical protein AB7Q81_05815 [Gammaproteobacteria bacterium]